MNTKQTAKLTKIPEKVLIRMRARETTSLKSGPPFCKRMSANGEVQYIYDREAVKKWLKYRRCLLTAADAAIIMACAREDILSVHGVKSFDIKTKEYKGRLVIDNGKNVYIWLPKGK